MIVENGTGLSNATSYCSLATADEALKYEAKFAEWQAKSDAERENALEYATQALDELIIWGSEKLTTTQALELPRVHFAVPSAVAKATAIVAFGWLINGIDVRNAQDERADISSISVPDLSISIKSVKSTSFSHRVLHLLAPYVITTFGSSTTLIERT